MKWFEIVTEQVSKGGRILNRATESCSNLIKFIDKLTKSMTNNINKNNHQKLSKDIIEVYEFYTFRGDTQLGDAIWSLDDLNDYILKQIQKGEDFE